MPDLSIIILSFNTKTITFNCLNSLYRSLLDSKKTYEIIIIDNDSTDGSKTMIDNFYKKNTSKKIFIKKIFNKKNIGFSSASNQGLKISKGQNILFLNSDTIIKNIKWDYLLDFFNEDFKIGVLTVKVLLPNGKIDPASHRGFPTIWNAFCYFIGFEKVFGKLALLNRIFGGYHLSYLNLNTIHEIDSPSGTFYLIKSNLIKKLKGFDEKFFMYGEDVDLSYRVKKLGYKVLYYPNFSVLHIKSISGLKKNNEKIRQKTKKYFYEAMRIFYDKHYLNKHSYLTNKLIHFVINAKLKIK